MGITADLSAVRAASKRKKQKSRSSGAVEVPNRRPDSVGIRISDDSISVTSSALERRKEASDEKAVSALRQQEILALRYATGNI